MKKKALIFFTTVTWLMILCPFALLGYINYQKYQEEEILEIDTSMTKASYHFTTFVTFRDEPNQKYEYIRIDKEIRQASPILMKRRNIYINTLILTNIIS
ncbi:hypothetical protein AAHH67_18915 [Niallia circulans]